MQAGVAAAWTALSLSILAAGCGGPGRLDLPGTISGADRQAQFHSEAEHRRRFQDDGDPAAIRWLKAHRLRPGMSIDEVNDVFGRDGVHVVADRRFKDGGSLYHRDDVVYRWGPDADGVNHYLVFREGKLVNYEPEEFGSGEE